MLGGHSVSDPPLPFPNRTVKRFRADDSELTSRESRSPPGSPPTPPQLTRCRGRFHLMPNLKLELDLDCPFD